MALRQPYTVSPQHAIPAKNDRMTPTSVLPPVKSLTDDNEPIKGKHPPSLTQTTNDIENIPSSIISDVKPNLFSQRSVESPSVIDNRQHQIVSDVILPIVTKQRKDLNTNLNGTFVSHIPMMSSSSSSSSLSIRTPTPSPVVVNEPTPEPVVKKIEQDESSYREITEKKTLSFLV